jgi:hypothetical protein
MKKLRIHPPEPLRAGKTRLILEMISRWKPGNRGYVIESHEAPLSTDENPPRKF